MKLPVNFKQLSPLELLQLQSAAVEELRDRKIVRTSNNPIGDYTEWLVAKALGLTLEGNSKAGYDAISDDGQRIQIKGRRYTRHNKSRQLSAIRNLVGADFDDLIAVVYDESFNIDCAYSLPHRVVQRHAAYRPHVNAHILILQGAILQDTDVTDLTSTIANVHVSDSALDPDNIAGQSAHQNSKPEPDSELARPCPACQLHIFKRWPFGWDAHAAHRCSGLEESDPELRKAEFKTRFMV